MLDVDAVKDVSVLRQVAKLQEGEIGRLNDRLREQARLIAQLQNKTEAQLAFELERLQGQLQAQMQRLYGDKTEKRKHAPDAQPGEAAQAQTGHGRREQSALAKVTEELFALDDKDIECKDCGGQMAPWPEQFEESEEVTLVERQYVLKTIKRQKFRCACCPSQIVTAKGPLKLQAGGRYSIEFAVAAAIGKYADHLPLERQVVMMQRDGLTIDSQTIWDQLWTLSRHLLASYEAIHAHVLKSKIVFADETFWRLMQPKEKDGGRCFVWNVASKDAVYQRIIETRGKSAAVAVLGDFSGVVMADGYRAYDAIAPRAGPMQIAHCWAHVRRKFFEIRENFSSPCETMLNLISELYGIERELPSMFDPLYRVEPELDKKRLALRHDKSIAVIEKIKRFAMETIPKTLPQSALRKAFEYMMGIWPGLTLFLANPNIPLDNNHAERALRSVVVGRKNHYGSRSTRGLDVAAIFYSLIGTAKLAGVDPREYLTRAASAAIRTPDAATLPWTATD